MMTPQRAARWTRQISASGSAEGEDRHAVDRLGAVGIGANDEAEAGAGYIEFLMLARCGGESYHSEINVDGDVPVAAAMFSPVGQPDCCVAGGVGRVGEHGRIARELQRLRAGEGLRGRCWSPSGATPAAARVAVQRRHAVVRACRVSPVAAWAAGCCRRRLRCRGRRAGEPALQIGDQMCLGLAEEAEPAVRDLSDREVGHHVAAAHRVDSRRRWSGGAGGECGDKSGVAVDRGDVVGHRAALRCRQLQAAAGVQRNASPERARAAGVEQPGRVICGEETSRCSRRPTGR